MIGLSTPSLVFLLKTDCQALAYNETDLVLGLETTDNYISGIYDIIMFGLHLNKVLCKFSLLDIYSHFKY